MMNILFWIKNNYKLVVLLYAILSTVCVGVLYRKYNEQKAETARYSNNQKALLSEIETYKTESGKNAARTRELELTNKEFKELFAEQTQKIKELGVNVKRLQTYSATVSETSVNGTTVLRDTVIPTIKVDSSNIAHIDSEKAKYFEWNDAWNKVSGLIKGDEVECSYSGTDTLTLITNKVPKKFLFFKWGCKYIEVNVVHQNPSSKIIYNQTIRFK